jgi:hypothetical protein
MQEPETPEDSPCEARLLAVGHYQCNEYVGTAQENGWHFASIGPSSMAVQCQGGAPLKWKNRAGVDWSLRPVENSTELAVGDDCPYFNSGHTSCTVEQDLAGRVTAVLGPGNERYDRVGDLAPAELQLARLLMDGCAPKSGPRVLRVPRCDVLHQRTTSRATAIIMPLPSKEADWRDLAYLTAIPTSSHLNDRAPVILVPHDEGTINDDSIADFLGRFRPTKVIVYADRAELTAEADSPGTVRIVHEACDELDSITLSLLGAWSTANSIVLAAASHYPSAVLAASFAARLDAPLILVDGAVGEAIAHAIQRLCPARAFAVGNLPPTRPRPPPPRPATGMGTARGCWIGSRPSSTPCLTRSSRF